MFAAEAKKRQLETLKKGDIPVPVNLPERKNQGKSRDKAASVYTFTFAALARADLAFARTFARSFAL